MSTTFATESILFETMNEEQPGRQVLSSWKEQQKQKISK